MICVESSVGNRYLLSFSSNFNTIRNLLITNNLHQFYYIGIPCAATSVGDSTRLIDATGDRLEVNSSSASGAVLLMLFRAVKSSIGRTTLLCSSALDCSLVCERPGSCYGRAVFIGDDLAVQSGPRSSSPHGQSAMVALVRRRG